MARPKKPSPVGIKATGFRTEHDSMGGLQVPADRYWGAQTARSLKHFSIGTEVMPLGVCRAYGVIKEAAAIVNRDAGRLDPAIAGAIIEAAREVASGDLDGHFPLHVWQTGSGTQTNMNVNEVITNRAIQLLGGTIGSKDPVHPNDHVNMGQSSNDTFPTAMHVSALLAIDEAVLPALRALTETIKARSSEWMEIVKIGRTHLQDAVPLTIGQEWSGYAAQLDYTAGAIEAARPGLLELAAGGTAVGTGLTAPEGFSEAIARRIAGLTGKPFVTAPNKFEAQSSLTAMLAAMSALRGLAVALFQIANNIRFLASGPRSGLGELLLPENEPGSSIMPGKVNPTQCEALIMVATQVMGFDSAVAIAASQGNFQLNTMRPMVIANFLNCARMLADGCTNFRRFAIEDTQVNEERVAELVSRSLMLVTAIAPIVGYDNAARIAHKAAHDGTTLREAALASGLIDADTFDRATDPRPMTGKGLSGA
ncbi:MAG TPA: class II fumarate hydratase [Rhizobiaceae bacterium]|nr:class II fumarate hydratase [Rhizobiaceae bacterium]